MTLPKIILLTAVCLAMVGIAPAQDPADFPETARIPAYGITNMPKVAQDAKPYKNYNDLSSARLKGKVKTVLLYAECKIGETKSVQMNERKHYSPLGDLVKSFTFEAHYSCDPAKHRLLAISAWGFKGKDRVEGRYAVAGMFTRPDRGEYTYVYALNGSNRLLEEKIFSADGKIHETSTYRYSDKKIECDRLMPRLREKPFPYTYFLDDKANVVKEIDGPTREHTFTKVDAKGNWLNRTTRVTAPAGNLLSVQTFYRLIEYYP